MRCKSNTYMFCRFGIWWMPGWLWIDGWTCQILLSSSLLVTDEIDVSCRVYDRQQNLYCQCMLRENHPNFASLERAWHPANHSFACQFTVTDREYQEQNRPSNRSCTNWDQILSSCAHRWRWKNPHEQWTNCWDARLQHHKAIPKVHCLQAVYHNVNDWYRSRKWIWDRKWKCCWNLAQYACEWPWKWSRKRYQNWRGHLECHQEGNLLSTCVLRGSMTFGWLLFSLDYSFVRDRCDGCPGAVLNWLGARISQCQGLWVNLILLELATLLIDRAYVVSTCLVIWFIRHACSLAYTHAFTRIHSATQFSDASGPQAKENQYLHNIEQLVKRWHQGKKNDIRARHEMMLTTLSGSSPGECRAAEINSSKSRS